MSRNNFIDNLSELVLDVKHGRDGPTARRQPLERVWRYDLDRDEIGDGPFKIQNVFQVMEGNVPEVRFYVLSPAAAVLEAAETTMPILRLGNAAGSPAAHASADPMTRFPGLEPRRAIVRQAGRLPWSI